MHIDEILKKIDSNNSEKIENAPSIKENILNKDNWLVGTFKDL